MGTVNALGIACLIEMYTSYPYHNLLSVSKCETLQVPFKVMKSLGSKYWDTPHLNSEFDKIEAQ